MDYLFIVNPVAGGVNPTFSEFVRRRFVSYSYEIAYTAFPGHATELAEASNASIVIAVGGDGTVNETANGLLGTSKVLGIVPCGSGNGLAYHLGIPRDIDKALDVILDHHVINMDVGFINEHMLLCTCGIGLDADVSMLFARSKRRGLATYVVDAVRAWRSFKYQACILTVDDVSFHVAPTLISIGNARARFNEYCQKSGDGYRVQDAYCPLIIYSPLITSRKILDEESFQMDVYPTIKHLIGCDDYYWNGFGVNLLDDNAVRRFDEESAFDLSDKMIKSNYYKSVARE